MGWAFRKSFNLGPLRINASKSGIGYSVDRRGFRVGKDYEAEAIGQSRFLVRDLQQDLLHKITKHFDLRSRIFHLLHAEALSDPACRKLSLI